jgi:hypothetical protein
VSLLEDIQLVAAGLTGSETPEHHQLSAVVGALIRTLEDAGVKVGDELLADAKTRLALAPPAPITVTAADQTKLGGLLERLEAALAAAEGTDVPKKAEPEPAS